MSGSHIRRLAAAFAVLVTALSPAAARVWYVNIASTQSPFDGSSWAKGYHTIRAATLSSAPGDEIWVAQGNYTEHVIMPSQVAIYGGFNGTENYRVEAHPETYLTDITGSASPLDGIHGSCITVGANVTGVVIDGFILRQGTGYQATDGVYGGGIFGGAGSGFRVSHCTFDSNTASGISGFGGALYYASSGTQEVSLTTNTFLHNNAWIGGAVYLKDANALIDNNNTFTGNNAAFGGAIAMYGLPSNGVFMGPNAFTGNTAQLGGAFYAQGASKLWFSDSTLTGNTADQAGGALYLTGTANITFIKNTLSGNKAGSSGGGIYSDGSNTVEIAGNILNGNGLTGGGTPRGGGIAETGCRVVNNDIVNSTHEGLWVAGAGSRVASNILMANPIGIGAETTAAAQLLDNDVYGNTAANYSGISPGAGDISQDPQFANLAGGDFHIPSTSPCVDAGDSALADTSYTDIDGELRIMGSAVDIGVDEAVQKLVWVTQPGPAHAGDPLSPQPVLKIVDAAGNLMAHSNAGVFLGIDNATGPPNARINGSYYVEVTAVNGIATFTNASITPAAEGYVLNAYGNFAEVKSAPFNILSYRGYVRPDGDDTKDGTSWATARQTIPASFVLTAGPNAEVWVAQGSYSGPVTVPDGVTLYGGFQGTETSRSQRTTGARSTITGTAVNAVVRFLGGSGNGIDGFNVTGGGGAPVVVNLKTIVKEGGGIYIEGASPTIRHCLISRNTAMVGGGIAVNGGTPVIQGNTIAQNSAAAGASQQGAGGGVALSGTAKVVFSDNLVRDNAATGETSIHVASVGGALMVSGSPTIRDNTFVNNQSPAGQGDIYITSGSATFTNNIINNHAAIEKTGGTPVFSHNDYIPGAAVVNPLPSISGSNGNVNVDPLFVNPGSDYHLAASSPLKDQGDYSPIQPGETDIDGEPRVMGANVDIGADEITVPYNLGDGASVLAIAGGLEPGSLLDILRFDKEPPTGIDLRDAERLIRKTAGLEPNP